MSFTQKHIQYVTDLGPSTSKLSCTKRLIWTIKIAYNYYQK